MTIRSLFPGILLITFLSVFLFRSEAQEGCNKTLDKKNEKVYADGISYFKRGNYLETQRYMKTILATEPEFPDALFVLGLTYYKRAEPNLKEAERYFLQTIRICPDYDVYTYLYLGEISYSYERYDSVIQFMNRFLADVDKIKKDEDYERALSLLNYSKFYLEMIGNPKPFKPVVVEGISTGEDEYLPALSPDNQIAFFTRKKKILPDKNSLFRASRSREFFMFSAKGDDGEFSEGEDMPDPFNINENEGGASLTADNNTLYYTVCQFDKVTGYLNCDIYYSEYINDEWGPIKNAGSPVNKPGSWESQPSIASDGQTLYFVSDRPGGYGGYDLYKAIKEEGLWGSPVNLGPVINSKGNEKSPFIHPDGQTLYFSSDGWSGMGGYDVFYSRMKDQVFQSPVNLGFPINSPEDDVGFFVSTDGMKGYFASNKYNGKGGYDLYTFDLYEAARPEKVLFIKGSVRDETSAEPIKAKIELHNLESKKIREIPLDTLTGQYVAVTPFQNDYLLTVKKEGYVYESKYLNREDSVLQKPAELDVDIQPIELNKSYRINDIYFPFNEYSLTPESCIVLDQLIDFLTFNSSIEIEIQGHTDNIGNDADNLRLSENRARAVFDYLVSKAVAKGRLSYKGYGETNPLVDNETEEGRAKNRRTCFVIIKK